MFHIMVQGIWYLWWLEYIYIILVLDKSTPSRSFCFCPGNTAGGIIETVARYWWSETCTALYHALEASVPSGRNDIYVFAVFAVFAVFCLCLQTFSVSKQFNGILKDLKQKRFNARTYMCISSKSIFANCLHFFSFRVGDVSSTFPWWAMWPK